MGKNILIFSDGTGQAGGIAFDENRSNIYKLYRATRCGPDSRIDPAEQVAFYDPGLGSPADTGFGFGKIAGKSARWLYNMASQATGLGVTRNIIDCYAALIRLYRDGDRIFLFGFSRGAYTVRSLAAVIAKCGVPRHLPGGKPLQLDVAGSRRLASYAVKHVYQFCSSRPHNAVGPYGKFLLDTRDLIARHFREEHGSFHPADRHKANVYPYFIGVFDTVAALGRPAAVILLVLGMIVIVAIISLLISFLSVDAFADVEIVGPTLGFLKFRNVFCAFFAGFLIFGLLSYVRNYVKFDFFVPGYGPFWKMATVHLAPPKHKFTEYSLDSNVEYAKHAISIDENRKDFKRVPWNPDEKRARARDARRNIYFEQVWFPGVHADIGGGYPENEARLSDIALKWMLAAASVVPHGIKYDEAVLRLNPDPTGIQHDESKAGHWQLEDRKLPTNPTSDISVATMHKSVYDRFAAPPVVLYNITGVYRPPNLRNHIDFAHYYTGGQPPLSLRAVADNVEDRFEGGAGPSDV